MPKPTIGFITNQRLPAEEDKKFLRIAEKVGVNLIVFNAAEKINLKKLEKEADKCDIIFNDEADYIGLEWAKTLETLGNKVLELSKTYYYTEDKWIFYLKCLKHKIPVPKTTLLPTDLISTRKELKAFNKFPVVIKRVQGFHGEFVDKGDDIDEAVKIIKNFWEKGEDRFPVLAQEFVDSDSYRVMTIGKKVVQTAQKKGAGWKKTGVSSARFWKFKIDKELKKILDKLIKITDIAVCGFDFARKNGRWVVIEVNAEPSFKFFNNEYNLMIEKTLKYLIKITRAEQKKTRR